MPENDASRLRFFMLLVCFFLSGAAGLIYQVAWSKALGLVFGTCFPVAVMVNCGSETAYRNR